LKRVFIFGVDAFTSIRDYPDSFGVVMTALMLPLTNLVGGDGRGNIYWNRIEWRVRRIWCWVVDCLVVPGVYDWV